MSRSYAVSYTTVCFNSCFWNCCSKFQHECNSTAMMKIDGLNVLKPGSNPHEWLLRLMRLLHVNGKKLQLVSGDTESKSFLTFNFTSFNMLLSLKFSVTLAGYSSANPWLVHSPVGLTAVGSARFIFRSVTADWGFRGKSLWHWLDHQKSGK